MRGRLFLVRVVFLQSLESLAEWALGKARGELDQRSVTDASCAGDYMVAAPVLCQLGA